MNESKTEKNRVEKITINDWWIPIDCSNLTEEEQIKYSLHPLEQYEQILADLIVKGIVNLTNKEAMKRLKSLQNYNKQTQKICENCTNFDLNDEQQRIWTGCIICRVAHFQESCYDLCKKLMESKLVIEKGQIYQVEATGKKVKQNGIRVKRSRWRGLWRNRWNWKKKAQELEKELEDTSEEFREYHTGIREREVKQLDEVSRAIISTNDGEIEENDGKNKS